MKTKSSLQDNCSGMTLVVVMVMTMLCSAAVSSVLYTVGAKMTRGHKQVDMEQAFYIAEAGLERVAAWVATGGEDHDPFTGTIGGGSYRATIAITPLPGGEIGVLVVSTGTIKGMSRTITVRGLQRVSWARYSLWYDQDPDGLSIAAGDEFKGRFYSKPEVRFIKPVKDETEAHFYDQVWTCYKSMAFNSAKPIFDRGYVLKAEEQSISAVSFAGLKTEANSGGYVFEGITTIELVGAQMKVTNDKKGYIGKVLPLPANGLVYVTSIYCQESYLDSKKKPQKRWVTKGDINISAPTGLNGELTLVSETTINIIKDIRYADNPAINPDSDDKLGLIAQKDVYVQDSCDWDVDIQAHIFCRDGGFGVQNYATFPPRGSLNVYGGIANLKRYGLRSGSSHGYMKNYIYDTRFARNPPPFYPRLTDVLEWDSWQG